jgi:hypothetical protein
VQLRQGCRGGVGGHRATLPEGRATTRARLHQGGTYVDLNDGRRQPFTALGGQEAGPEHRYVAKRDTDHELWNRLVGQGREVEVERPAEAQE